MPATLSRFCDALIAKHLAAYRQMAFISGPRQVGKTTTARLRSGIHFDWDDPAHRKLIASGAEAVAAHAGLRPANRAGVIIAGMPARMPFPTARSHPSSCTQAPPVPQR